MFNNLIYELGQLFENEVIPKARCCDAEYLAGLQDQLIRYQTNYADHLDMKNIDLEWVYEPYKAAFNKAIMTIPKKLSQQTLNLFTQL